MVRCHTSTSDSFSGTVEMDGAFEAVPAFQVDRPFIFRLWMNVPHHMSETMFQLDDPRTPGNSLEKRAAAHVNMVCGIKGLDDTVCRHCSGSGIRAEINCMRPDREGTEVFLLLTPTCTAAQLREKRATAYVSVSFAGQTVTYTTYMGKVRAHTNTYRMGGRRNLAHTGGRTFIETVMRSACPTVRSVPIPTDLLPPRAPPPTDLTTQGIEPNPGPKYYGSMGTSSSTSTISNVKTSKSKPSRKEKGKGKASPSRKAPRANKKATAVAQSIKDSVAQLQGAQDALKSMQKTAACRRQHTERGCPFGDDCRYVHTAAPAPVKAAPKANGPLPAPATTAPSVVPPAMPIQVVITNGVPEVTSEMKKRATRERWIRRRLNMRTRLTFYEHIGVSKPVTAFVLLLVSFGLIMASAATEHLLHHFNVEHHYVSLAFTVPTTFLCFITAVMAIVYITAGERMIKHHYVLYKDPSKWLPDEDLRTDLGKTSRLEHDTQRLARFEYTRSFCFTHDRKSNRKNCFRFQAAMWWENFVRRMFFMKTLSIRSVSGEYSEELLAQACNSHNMSVRTDLDTVKDRVSQVVRTKASMPLNRFDQTSARYIVGATEAIGVAVWMDQQRRLRHLPFVAAPSYSAISSQ